MVEYRQAGNNGAQAGWFIDVSNNDLVYLDSSGNVRQRIDDATGNLTAPGTLAVTGAATLSSTLGVTGATTLAAVSTTGATTTTAGVGAVAAEGTLVSEAGVGKIHRTELTFTKGTSAAGAALADGARCYTFPAVPVLVKGIYVSATLTAATDTATPELGAGTVIGSGANATLGAVGATSEDFIEGTASEAFSSGGTAATRNSVVTVLPTIFSASSVLHINWAATYTATETVTVAGTVVISWEEML